MMPAPSRSLFLAVLIAALLVPGHSFAEALPSAGEVIAKMEAAFSLIEDYLCTADAHYAKGPAREDKVFRIDFKKPELVRVEVLSGDGEGGVAVLTARGEVKAHAGGWLSWLVVHPRIDSPLVTTLRGHTLKQSHFGNMIKVMKGLLASQEAIVSGVVFDGAPCYRVETSFVGGDGVEMKKAVIVERGSYLIRKIEELEDGLKVVDVSYYSIRTGRRLKKDLFDM